VEKAFKSSQSKPVRKQIELADSWFFSDVIKWTGAADAAML
jgi:hypothetical protein